MEEILDENERIEDVIFFRKPGLILRVKSMLIDSLILIGLMLLISWILNSLNIESGRIRGMALVIVVFYEPILIVFKGTIGQRMMGLRVVKSSKLKENGVKTSINIFNSFVRYLTKILLGWISLLTIHSDNYGQAIHDKLGQSIMTYK